MDSDELQKLAVAILRRRIRSKRKYWVHPLNLLRPSLGEHLKLELMYSKYPKLFFDYTRLLPNQFDYMFGLMETLRRRKNPQPQRSSRWKFGLR